MMEKLFKKKTMRRIVCFLILVAPLVYMFGALIAGLAGAHGSNIFTNGSLSDYIFGQFFVSDNWLADIGNKVINGQDAGIPAISTLLNYLEVNAFHAGAEPYGAFLYGYAVYAVNALIIYELVCIGLSVIMIPLKVTDWLERKGDIDL